MSRPSERDGLLGALEAPSPARESFLRRLLSVPAAVAPISLFSFGGPPAHLALAHDTFVCAFLSACMRPTSAAALSSACPMH